MTTTDKCLEDYCGRYESGMEKYVDFEAGVLERSIAGNTLTKEWVLLFSNWLVEWLTSVMNEAMKARS